VSLSEEDRELDRMLRTVNAAMDAQAAEIERLRDRNVEVAMLAHQWMVAHDRLKAGETYDFPSPADVPACKAALAEAVGEIRSTAAFLEDFERADLDEPISDGGHTAGPLFQQQARRYLRAARDFITKHGGEREADG
jgi:hypothetical protein